MSPFAIAVIPNLFEINLRRAKRMKKLAEITKIQIETISMERDSLAHRVSLERWRRRQVPVVSEDNPLFDVLYPNIRRHPARKEPPESSPGPT